MVLQRRGMQTCQGSTHRDYEIIFGRSGMSPRGDDDLSFKEQK